MGQQTHIRLGTRKSALAMWQAERVKVLIEQYDSNCNCVLVPIQTSGDVNVDQPISDIGGKGIFLKEIEQALINNDIDIAVHSFKDITSIPNSDLTYSGFILEESITDAFILFNGKQLTDESLTIATGSLRRKALCKDLYPNITCVDIRGNIQTRINKAEALGYDGLMLSTAGLQRLGMDHLITHECAPTEFIPAPGQGIIAIQQRSGEHNIQSLVEAITDTQTNQLARHYYQLLEGVQFNCGIPFGAFIDESNHLKLFVEKDGGGQYFTVDLMKKEWLNLVVEKVKSI
jgi:hydroxymethylbilane synthase